MKLSLSSFFGAAAATALLNVGPRIDAGKALAVRPIHNEPRRLKRLSRPVHPDRMDPRKATRVRFARFKSCLGELETTLGRYPDPAFATQAYDALLRKHKLIEADLAKLP